MALNKTVFTTLTAYAMITAGYANAGVIALPDALDLGPNPYPAATPLGVTLTGEEAIYLVGTMTFDTLTLGSGFNEAELRDSGTRVIGFGKQWATTLGGTVSNGGGLVDNGINFAEGVPITFVQKINQTTGEVILWADPDLGLPEDVGTAQDIRTIGNVNGSTINEYSPRGFNGTVDYTDFAIYFGGDTPFVPEPTTGAIALLGLGGLVMRRRRG